MNLEFTNSVRQAIPEAVRLLPLISASPVLELQVCTAMPDVFCTDGGDPNLDPQACVVSTSPLSHLPTC